VTEPLVTLGPASVAARIAAAANSASVRAQRGWGALMTANVTSRSMSLRVDLLTTYLISLVLNQTPSQQNNASIDLAKSKNYAHQSHVLKHIHHRTMASNPSSSSSSSSTSIAEKLAIQLEALLPSTEGTHGHMQYDLDHHCNLLQQTVALKEMKAAIFVWDRIFARGWTPTEQCYTILSKLHGKKTPESKNIRIPKTGDTKTLAPARRIHKIIKGWNVKKTNVHVFDHVDKATKFFQANPDLIYLHRNVLSKKLTKECGIKSEVARRLVTKLKQKRVLPTKAQCIQVKRDNQHQITQ